jgi:exonuclease SbcC
MRLHALSVSAFGPFAIRQTVDFDALAEHGLFLLNGATGAGKTSVLDAVCFALYGSLPGARQGSKSLKSHHADATAEPEVVLEFSAQGRRFEVRRTPSWDRPSARSKNGFTTQQASTHLRELVEGEWRALSSRNDEASALVREVLGMDREQFTRVAMLPQGEFAAFLRSDPKERERLLESLFGTGRFADIESQLSAMGQVAESAAAEAEQAARWPLRQLESELAAHPEAVDSGDGEARGSLGRDVPVDARAPLDAGAAETLFATALVRFDALARSAGQEIEEARGEVSRARASEERARRCFDDAAELAAARSRRARWESNAPHQAARVEKLRRAAEAADVRAELEGERQASEVYAQAESELMTALAAAAAAGWTAPEAADELSPIALRTEAGDARANAAVLAERMPVEAELDGLETELSRTEAESERQRAALARLEEELTAVDEAIVGLAAEQKRLEPVAASLAGAQRDERAAREVLVAVEEHAVASERLSTAELELARCREEALSLRAQWLDLREERLESTAFELAAALEEGVACPVCGSPEHPRPAKGDEDPLRLVDREKDALAAAERAAEREREAASALTEAKAVLAAVEARGGDADPDKAARELDEAVLALRSAQDAEQRLASVSQQLAAREARRRSASEERELASTALTLAAAEARRLVSEAQRRSRELAEWRAGWPSLGARHAALTAVVRALEPLADAAAQAVGDRARLAAARRALDAALAGTAFGDAAEARSAMLGDDEIEALRSAVAAHDAEEQAISGLLSSAAAQRAAAAEEDGSASREDFERLLASAAARLQDAEARLAAAHAAEHAASAARVRCEGLRREFLDALPVLEATRARAELLGELQRTARGSGENRLRMSLHRYVLAARLEHVAIAASERLAVMSDGRFSLEHSDALAARGAASGLGLDVLDAWTGQRRDPATLSGGESFMASLALALGLADVVQHEAGGIDIETLFVDEGFGTLDEQTLEQVMEAIEGLRDGGRTVGLVSHVAELKQRIPAQIRVDKGRSGSRLEVVTGQELAAIATV